MTYPDGIDALVNVNANDTLAAGGHAARHNSVNTALVEVKDYLVGALGSKLDASVISSTGAWTTFTPVFTNVTVGNGTSFGSYLRIGKVVFCRFRFALGSTSAITGNPIMDLPVPRAAYGQLWAVGTLYMEDAGISGYAGHIRMSSAADQILLSRFAVTGSNVTSSSISSTAPFTWGTNDSFAGEFTYEAA
jgi:hypothetical protein